MKRIQTVETLDILGVPVSFYRSYEHALQYILERVRGRRRTFCVAVNPEKIFRARQDQQLLSLLHAADVQICDGVGAALAARLLHGRRVCRVTGVQLFLDLVASASRERLAVFLLGASPESNAGACQRLQVDSPDLRIAGAQDGYFQDTDAVIGQINDSGADMLFVAMGSPKQEKWIYEHLDRINVPLCMGVGGSFDVLSGRAKWAPRIVRKLGFEFLYRLMKEPTRWRRQICLPVFAFQVILAKLSGTYRKPAESYGKVVTLQFPPGERKQTVLHGAEAVKTATTTKRKEAA
jgi:N-acetylglucosaminyldiphosphoundecaprenol N-acetyl-beta-D-mannosaminyltransferase